jgi:signal peptidase I
MQWLKQVEDKRRTGPVIGPRWKQDLKAAVRSAKIDYRHLRDPKRFDLVVFDVPPASKWSARGIPWMKRVIAMPGEHVRLSGTSLFINGRKMDAPFLHLETNGKPRDDITATLGSNEYFVLGDNLDQSFDDSRTMGPIGRPLMRGFVWFVCRPHD